MILYKYFPCNEFTYRSLSVKGLWCHTYENMNDPFECLHILENDFDKSELDVFRQVLLKSKDKKLEKTALLNDHKLENLINKFRKKSIENFAFCSLTEDPKNILMWSHYGNSHKGVVVGFEFPELEGNSNLQKVEYEDELQELDLSEYARFLIGESDEYHAVIMKSLSVKSKVWKYEKEWRIWRDSSCYYGFKPESIKEVYFGLNTEIETKAIIVQLTNYLPKDFIFNELELAKNPLRLE